MKVFYLLVILAGSSSHALDRDGNHKELLPGDDGSSVKIIGREKEGKTPSTQLPDLGLNPREQKRAGKKIANGVSQDVEAFGVCKAVQNGFGEDLFIPLGSSFEWKQFRENPPNNVLITDCSLATNKCPENYAYDGEFCIRRTTGKKPSCPSGYIPAHEYVVRYGAQILEGSVEPNICYKRKELADVCEADYKYWADVDDCLLRSDLTTLVARADETIVPPAPSEYPYNLGCSLDHCKFSKVNKPNWKKPTCKDASDIEYYYSAAVTCLDADDTKPVSCESGFSFRPGPNGRVELDSCERVDKVKPIEG